MKKYQLILADPPWQYAQWTDSKQGAAVSAYNVMKDDDLLGLPIQNIAADDALLFLWGTFPKMPLVLRCLESWGFEFVTFPFIWNKLTPSGDKPHHGIGFWTMGSAEFIVLGRRGKGIPRRKDTRGQVKQMVTLPRGAHSAKPAEFRDLILQLVEGNPRCIELFARERTPGWDATGLDLDGVDIRDFLKGPNREE